MVSGRICLIFGEQLDPVHSRHAEVGEHDVGLFLLQEQEAGARVVGARDLVAVLPEQRLEGRRGVDLVVDDDHPSLRAHGGSVSPFSARAAGRLIVKVAPSPGVLSARISPP